MSKATIVKGKIDWSLINNDTMIKLVDNETIYYLSDAVLKFVRNGKNLTDAGEIKENTTVELSLNEDDPDHVVVEKLIFSKASKSDKSEVKTETTEGLITQEATLKAMGKKYRGLIFEELGDVWYTLDQSIDIDAVEKFKGSKCSISVLSTEKGKNDIIKSIKQLEKPKEEKPVDSKNKSTFVTGDARQKSIEAQASVNSACQVVARIAKELDSVEVNRFVSDIAKNNFKIIQELKNS